ncbi:MAG: hypothetical protein HW421_293 [Ignavibacteria bacterium]|nr:hypothetical protein [Ignavibacteria bacterium]
MNPQNTETVELLSEVFGLSEDQFFNECLKLFLDKKLRAIGMELLTLKMKYKIESIKDFEILIQSGKIDKDSSIKEFKYYFLLSKQREFVVKYLEALDNT